MDQRTPSEFSLDIFADPSSVRDVVKGILHTIFFHRFFPGLSPHTRDVLDLTLPYVDDVELETLIEQRVTSLLRELESSPPDHQPAASRHHNAGSSSSNKNQQQQQYTTGSASARATGGGRGQVTIQFNERKRRKGWIMSPRDEEICWETWTLTVTVAEPRTEMERAKVRRAMEQTLLTNVMKIVTHVNAHKDHIPPITHHGTNPFPYQIHVNQKETGGGWASRMGIYSN